jgi:dienelactone hydrolase
MKKKFSTAVLILGLIPTLSLRLSAQSPSPEDVYKRPLEEVLKQVEQQYHVKLEYEQKNVKGLNVSYATWKFRKDFAETMDNILKPLDLAYNPKGNATYEVTKYEYFRRTEAEGAYHLQQLLTLYHDAAAFDERRRELRTCIFQTLGINPAVKRPPLNAIIRPKRVMNGYTVENVAFESFPGYYVTGSLYRPSAMKNKVPVILCPHGHFYNKVDPSIPNERGRYRPDMQYRCAALARMGAIVLDYDMYGYGESVLECGDKKFHRSSFANAIQTWNSIRAIDFLLSLDEADPQRVGVTGASGGGTQTFLVTALDDRVTASVPVVMVSSAFYGGCPCESGLPIHDCGRYKTNNAEIAALAAPRPQLVISDGNDWTKSVPGTDFPYLQKVYAFYGKKDQVQNVHLPHDQHDYGFTKRVPMYRWFAGVFGLNLKAITDKSGNIDESAVTIEPAAAQLVFGEGSPLPPDALKSHDAIVKAFGTFFTE